MIQEGSEFDKLRISYVTETNRIVKAIADIKKGETCLFVPKKLMISTERVKEVNNPYQQKLSAAGLNEYKYSYPTNI
jgi:hypothetical protein